MKSVPSLEYRNPGTRPENRRNGGVKSLHVGVAILSIPHTSGPDHQYHDHLLAVLGRSTYVLDLPAAIGCGVGRICIVKADRKRLWGTNVPATNTSGTG